MIRDEMELKERIEAAGYGAVKAVLHTATILHSGWEMDNEGWIVEMESGDRMAFTTSHGGLQEWGREEAIAALHDTERAAQSIMDALKAFPPE